ncbi:hypothetical protein, partial [Martelella sp. AD-3]
MADIGRKAGDRREDHFFVSPQRDMHGDAPVSYGEFVTSIANETPARLSDIGKVTALLVGEKGLDIGNAANSPKRTSSPIYRDTIGVFQQTRLWPAR